MRLPLLLLVGIVLLHAEDAPILVFCSDYENDRETCLQVCLCIWCQLEDGTGSCLVLDRDVNKTCPRGIGTPAPCRNNIGRVAIGLIVLSFVLVLGMGFAVAMALSSRSSYQQV